MADSDAIVFVWSQYDGGNIDKEQCLRFLPKPNEAKLIIASYPEQLY